MKSNKQDIKFRLHQAETDFFKLHSDYFEPYGKNITVNSIKLDDDYLNTTLKINDFKEEKKETVVLNMQVGIGKSTFLYKLIEEFYQEGYQIIVCSPFIKLVNKDFEYLNEKLSRKRKANEKLGTTKPVCNYLEVAEWDIEDTPFKNPSIDHIVNTCKVHVMTFNCFSGNPGDTQFEQSFYKSNYLDKLLEATKDDKVILLIDEIHETIHNFKIELFPRILKWKNQIQKIFISSATYTPSAIPVINFLSILTENTIRIFEANRMKNQIRAKILLNILPYNYYSKHPKFKSLIKERFNKHISRGRNVNIITAYKSFAEELAPYLAGSEVNVIRDSSDVNKEASLELINVLTADTNVEYQKGQNNIGTTFKTGIDITEKNGVLFIIFPSISPNHYNTSYGIFTNGISSIIQAIGRLRNGGTIEIFISDPECILDETNLTADFTAEKQIFTNYKMNDEYDMCKAAYEKIVTRDEQQIKTLENDLEIAQTASLIADSKAKFGFWYPNFHEFLLKDKRARFTIQEPAFGKYISPYILWACLNDQFQNATLHKIKYYKKSIATIEITDSNCKEVFKKLIQAKHPIIKYKSVRRLIDNASKYFGVSNENDEEAELKFVWDGKPYQLTTLLNRKHKCAKSFIDELLSYKLKADFTLDENEYIRYCIAESIEYIDSPNALQIAYLEFKILVEDYIKWVKSEMNEDKLILKKAMWNNSNCEDAIKKLIAHDWILKSKTISFFQNINSASINNEFRRRFLDTEEVKKKSTKFYKIKAFKDLTEKFLIELL